MTTGRRTPAPPSDRGLLARFAHWCHGPTAFKARERASRLMRQERTAENEPFLRWAVRRYPRDMELRLLLGMTICTSDSAGARHEVQTVISLGGDHDVRRLAMAALAMWHAGENDLAAEYCARAEKLSWTIDELAYASDFMNISGLLAFADKDYDRAEDLLSLAVAADPDSAAFASDLAAFLACVDRTDEARDVVKAAIDRGLDGRHLSTVRADLGV
ncbi:MAG: hypothetical protein JHD16_11750 [Solirubrobacteraceae bacterium]|nr:hypothetical protein [Solirubrobacteraceae bacterium]